MPVVLVRPLLTSVLGVIALFQASNVSALGLIEAYEAALQNDANYRVAYFDNQAGQQFKEIGFSNLLPNVSANYSISKNSADIVTEQITSEVKEHRSYDSIVGSIQVRQPLLNLDGMARYRQGVAQTKFSDAQFASRKQELMVRLVGVFASAKYAEDQLALAVAQRDAFAEQRKANDRMFVRGEGTKTDMLETQAKFDLSETQVLEATDNLTNARNALAAMVGMEITTLDSLAEGFRVQPMQPESFDEWKAIALAENSDIIGLRHAVEVAQQEVNKNRAGHAPRLDAIASLAHNSSDTTATFNQTSDIRSLGVQLTIPLYSGGSVNALTSQAISNHEKAQAELDGKINQVLIELRKQYNLTLSSKLRIDALVKSVSSGEVLVIATKKSVSGGIRTNFNVLDAQQELFEAKRDLALARYSYLLSYLRLRSAAGIANMSDLQNIASYFVTTR